MKMQNSDDDHSIVQIYVVCLTRLHVTYFGLKNYMLLRMATEYYLMVYLLRVQREQGTKHIHKGSSYLDFQPYNDALCI